MPTKWTRPLALVVALTAVLSMAPWLIAAEGKSLQLANAGHATPSPASEEGANQAHQSLPGEGLGYQHDEGAGTDGSGRQRLEVYDFVFDETAYIPERRYPEAMVVQVVSGSFSICVGDEDLVIVDPGFQDDNDDKPKREIPIVREGSIGEPSCDLFSPQDPSGDFVRRLDGDPCTELCALPPGTTVLIEEGATVYLPRATTCFWCNVTKGQASLRVFPVLPQVNEVPFSWTELVGISTLEAEALATPETEALYGARHFYHVTLSGLGVGCM